MTEPTSAGAILRRCSRCQEHKPLAEFCKDRQRKDGLSGRCRECRNALNRAVREKNPEAARERSGRYAKADPERTAGFTRRWRQANPDYSAEANRKWREANPERSSEWYQANREKVRANYLRRRALIREVSVGDVDLDALWAANGDTCQLCLVPIDRTLRGPDPMAASVDHIVPLSKGGTHEQANLQWAHLVCNKRKGATVPD